MPRQLRVTKQAGRDFRGVQLWFRQPGAGHAAASRLERLEAAIADLLRAPYALASGPRAGTRLLISQRHRVLYRIIPDTGDSNTAGDIFLLRIYGPGQAGD